MSPVNPSRPTFFADADAFREWLKKHAASADMLLVGFRKVGSGQPSMTWPQSVDEALCYGWIDGVRKRIDDVSYVIRFTPRKPTSIWSDVNVAKFEQLRSKGRMTPAGVKAFEQRRAERSGVYSHERTDDPELTASEVEAFKKDSGAWAFFQATPPSYRKVVLHWITTAKQVSTRATRLAKLVAACATGVRLK